MDRYSFVSFVDCGLTGILVFSYRIIGQSMVIEKSTVGGGIVQVEKTSWTLEKQ